MCPAASKAQLTLLLDANVTPPLLSSQLMGDPSFSLWKLIDQPAGDPSSSPKQPKSKSECSANQEQRALRNITSNVEAIANQASCFNIFNPISNL